MTKIINFKEFKLKNERLFNFFKKKNNHFTEDEFQKIRDIILNPKINVSKNFISGTIVSSVLQYVSYNPNIKIKNPIKKIEISINNGKFATRITNTTNNFINKKIGNYFTIDKIGGIYYINLREDILRQNSIFLLADNSIQNICEKLNKLIFKFKLSRILEVSYERLEKLLEEYSILSEDFTINKFRLEELVKELYENPIHFNFSMNIMAKVFRKINSSGMVLS